MVVFFLSKEKQVKIGYKKLKVITLASEVIKKFRIVIVYFKVKFTPAVEYHIQKSNELRIQCFVLDSFVEHVMIEGL